MKKITFLFLSLIAVLCLCLSMAACSSDSTDGANSVSKECEHQFLEEVTRQANCTESGMIFKHCKLCGDSELIPTEALGHDYTTENEKLPTCTSTGFRYSVCNRCGGGFSEDLPATGHNYTATIPTSPTEEHNAFLNYECSVCYHSGSEQIPTLGDPAYKKTVIDDETTDYTYTWNGIDVTFRVSALVIDVKWNEAYKFPTYVITGYTGNKTELVLPSTYNGMPIVGIEDYAFANNENIVSIVIPEPTFTFDSNDLNDSFSEEAIPVEQFKLGYESIGENAFFSCVSLKSVTLPSSVNTIEIGAFNSCENLESINLENVNTVQATAFLACESLKSVKLEKVTIIEDLAFAGCTALSDLTLGNNLTEIYNEAFINCDSLKEVVLPESLEKVRKNIFADCDGIESITMPKIYGGNFATLFSGNYYSDGYFSDVDPSLIPESLTTVIITAQTEIPSRAFYNCASIKKIVLPDATTSIGERAFSHCYGLEEFVIPDGIVSIGTRAFEEVNAFNFNQDFDNKTYYIGTKTNPYFYLLCGDANAISGEHSEVVIRDGCKYVAVNAFTNCSDMTALTIPASIEYLGKISTKRAIVNDQTLKIYYNGTVERFTELGCSITGWYLYLYVNGGEGEFSEVTEMVVSDKVTEALDSQFIHFVNIDTIRIPVSLKKFTGSVFWGAAFDKVYYEGTIADWCEIEFTGESANPMSCASEFYIKDGNDWVKVTDIVIPDTVKKLLPYTFYGFDELNTLVIPESIEKVYAESYFTNPNVTAIYYGGTPEEWASVYVINFGTDNAAKYFYSETTPSLSDFINGSVDNLWHYTSDGEAVLWSESKGNATNGKTYSYTSSTVSVSDAYWEIIVAAKAQGVLEYMIEDPITLEMAKSSNTKAEFEAAFVEFYADWGKDLKLAFANGTLTLSQNGDSTTLQYIELDGIIYYVLTGAKGFTVIENATALNEAIADEYITVTHYYTLVTE